MSHFTDPRNKGTSERKPQQQNWRPQQSVLYAHREQQFSFSCVLILLVLTFVFDCKFVLINQCIRAMSIKDQIWSK